MNLNMAIALADEFEKIAGLQDRPYMHEPKQADGRFRRGAAAAFNAAHRGFSRMGPVGQAATVSGLAGGLLGGFNGLTRDDVAVDEETGQARYPNIGDRLKRGGVGALRSGLTSAAVGGGATYLLRRALHAG